MKKALFTLVCLLVMATGTSLQAQEVTIFLNPGWTWISCPSTDTLDFVMALGSFTPEVGDVIKSRWGSSNYLGNGQWRGRISQFYPGYGFMYYSNRTMPVMVSMGTPLPEQEVTTMEPTDITAASAVVGGIVIIEENNHIFARGVCWGTEEMPAVDGNHKSGEIVAGSQSFMLDSLTSGTTYFVRAYMVTDYGLAYGNQRSFTTDSEHAYVDLGLPSGLLWATCNVGANSPEQHGNYFAWGETQPKDYYDWSTYQYCNGSENTLTKYCDNSDYGYNGFIDSLTTLLPEDDAAMVNWGEDWRIPTNEEWQELYNNTTQTWATQNGVRGQLFTASNGNSLFLPAAGCRFEGSIFNAGSDGNYWSSILETDSPCYAWDFYFFWDDCSMSYDDRYSGRSVRPVRSARQN